MSHKPGEDVGGAELAEVVLQLRKRLERLEEIVEELREKVEFLMNDPDE